RGVQALVRVVTAANPFEGAYRLVETYGLGAVVPNTIILGDSENAAIRDRYCQMIRDIHGAKRSIVVLREDGDRGFGARSRIDIWWGGLQANGSLMLLLAYLLCKNISWRKAQIYLKLVVPDSRAAAAAQTNLEVLIAKLRITALPQVLISEGRSFNEILHSSSENADLIFLGMAKPDNDMFVTYYEKQQILATGLPTTLFVLAAPDFAFEEVLVEST
ncbi:Na-K-Cl cotransporter, partial [Spirulina sp. 06S082]|nr:Na-K-Cl cotransporter [Spirulina sp. 06S082]